MRFPAAMILGLLVVLGLFYFQADVLETKEAISLPDKISVDILNLEDYCSEVDRLAFKLDEDELRTCNTDQECTVAGGISGCGQAIAFTNLDLYRQGYEEILALREAASCMSGPICRARRSYGSLCTAGLCTINYKPPIPPPKPEFEFEES